MDKEVKAECLVFSAYTSDIEASRKFGVTVRSIQLWRRAMETDDELSAFFAIKHKAFEAKHASGSLDDAINSAIEFTKRGASNLNPSDPVCIETMANVAKTLSSIQTTRRILDARLKSDEQAPPDAD